MELILTVVDRCRLQNLRIARLVEILPGLSGLGLSVNQNTLCIDFPRHLLGIAAIALGIGEIEIHLEGKILCRLSLESVKSINSTSTNITMAAVLERETSSISTHAGELISWQNIAATTGETETTLKMRSQDLGINFHWLDDDWGVSLQDAQVLAIRYYADLGNAIARSFGGIQDAPTVAEVEPEPVKQKRRKPKPLINFKSEFKPTKNPKVTVERYLSAIASESPEQLQILHDIVTDANVARQHLNKALANMSADLKDGTTRAKLQAAFTNLHERASKPMMPENTQESNEIAPD